MSWADGDIWAFDVETSGLNHFEDRILTAALVRLSPDDTVLERSWVINAQVPIAPKAAETNGLTPEYLAEHGQDPADAIEHIGRGVRWVLDNHLPLVVQNAPFDMTMLEVELQRHGLEPIGVARMATVVDPSVLIKYDDKTLAKPPRFKDPKTGKGYKYRLPDLCARFRVPFVETHEACADATGAARVARVMVEKQPLFGDMKPDRLFTLQRTACRQQKDSLRAHFDREGIEHDGVDTGWPLHTRLQAVTA